METPRPRGWSFVPLLVGRVLALRTGVEQVFLREEMGKLRSPGGALAAGVAMCAVNWGGGNWVTPAWPHGFTTCARRGTANRPPAGSHTVSWEPALAEEVTRSWPESADWGEDGDGEDSGAGGRGRQQQWPLDT